MKRYILTFTILLISFVAQAQIPSGYYDNANGKTGDELKAALHDIIKDHSPVTYSNISKYFQYTDNKGENVVWDMYSDGANYIYHYTSNYEDQCGEYEQEGDCYNREHSWPKSWFNNDENSTPGRDMHHIFPTDGFVNSQRSNYPFGEVNNASWTSQNGSKLGTCKSSLGYSGTVFEPIDEYKGDFARAIMYMSVRYYTEDSDWGSSGMTEKSVIKPWAIAMLLNWSDNDPVSQKEIDRNNIVFGYQGNRNPFIDYPDYAHMIWDGNWSGNGDYVKVTSQPEDWSGNYLIVYETGNKAFNGSLTTLDAASNTIDISVIGGTITATDATIAAQFTIAKSGNNYTIKSASDKYIGLGSNANGLTSSDTPLNNTITFDQGNVNIVSSGGAYLRYNASSGQERFRYYKSSSYTGQQAIQLFKKNELYTITCVQVEHGTISANLESALEGTTILLTVTPDAGYEFEHWIVTDASSNIIPVTGNQFVMPASDVTVSASFVNVGIISQEYQLVTSTDQLVAGKNYLIVNTTAKKALGKAQNTNNRSAVDVVIANNAIATLGDACELTLGGSTGAWTLFDAGWGTNGGYLYAASSSSNQLKTRASNSDANSQWNIAVTTAGVATIKAQGSNTRNLIKYNSGSTLFSCYASGQQDVCLFVQTDVFEKDIVGYSDNGGWYTIAAPFADFTPIQIAMGNYDLYAYDEDGEQEWINYKNTANFPVSATSGYLYAHHPDTTLRMTGTLNSDGFTTTVNLSYANSDSNLKGYNLLGNPTAHNITFNKSDNVSDGYYYLANSETWVYEASNNVPTGRGFLVKANATGQTVTLNPQSKGDPKNDPYLCVSIDDDKAYVKMNEGVSMPLLALNGKHQNLYLTNSGKSYVMLVKDDTESINMTYQPQRQGHHTLNVSVDGLGISYLHLIDHITGADIDLLDTPHYSFESSCSDYPSRFQLRFSANINEDTNEGDFAYYADGKIHLLGNYENATLQIFDMTGRQVYTMTSGIYVLRLITPERIKVQKITIY